MNLTDWLTLAALIVAGVAAVFAGRADVFGRRSRAKDIRPQPRIQWVGPGPGGVLRVAFFNVGGPAVHAAWIGAAGPNFYASYATFDGHTNDYVEFVPTDLGPLPDGSPLRSLAPHTLMLIAQDVDGRWWDCVKDERIRKPTAKFALGELKKVHLDDAAGRVYEVCRLG